MQPVADIGPHDARGAQVVAFPLHRGGQPVYNLAGGVDAGSTPVDPAVPRH